MEATLAEARAVLMAIRLCKNRGFDQIIFEGDAKAVINAVHSEEMDGSSLSVIVANIRCELQSFQHWQLAFVR
jgi:ribonuclease HI